MKRLNKHSDSPTRAGTMSRRALQVIAELTLLPANKGTDSDVVHNTDWTQITAPLVGLAYRKLTKDWLRM